MWKREPNIEEIIISTILTAVISIAAFVGAFISKYHFGGSPWFFVLTGIVFLVCSITMLFWWMDLKELPHANEDRIKTIAKNIITYKVTYYLTLMLYVLLSIGILYYFIFSIF